MRTCILFILIAMLESTQAQVVYPFNPDSNNDTLIGAGDLLETLSSFGNTFQPASITVDSIPLETVLTELIALVGELQNQISDLEASAITADSVLTLTWKKSFSSMDLTQAEFIDSDLSYADFTGADLSGINMSNSDLYLASLNGSNLSNTNLSNTDLYQASLMGANLSNADLTYAFLGGVDLTGSTVDGANFTSTYLTGATMLCLVGCPILIPDGFECVPDDGCAEPGRTKLQAN